MEKKLFLGANLPYREHTNGYEGTEKKLINLYKLKKLYLLKGGSGLGKGTFMKKFANAFSGYDIDYYYCSGDVRSLDGVIIKEPGIGIIDATLPHILDTTYPALGIDEIIDLAQFIIPEKVHARKEVIDEILEEKARHYKTANEALTEALKSKGNYKKINLSTVRKLYLQVEKMLLKNGVKESNIAIIAFARSFTSLGVTDFRPDWAESDEKIIKLSCSEATASEVFKKLHQKFGGYAFLHYLDPSMLEGIYIGGFVIILDPKSEAKMSKMSVKKAIDALEHVDKFNHGRMEREYSDCMDFKKVDALLDTILARHL